MVNMIIHESVQARFNAQCK